jgi:ABC-2 type transport system permease protein
LVWALAKPLADIAIYYIAFKVMLKTDIPNFVSYFFIALVLWNFFVESTTGTTNILATKKYLYEFTNMNKIEIYVSVIGSNIIGLLFNLSMFYICYLFLQDGAYLSIYTPLLFAIIINLAILSLGVSLILSSLFVIAKDIAQVWSIVIGLGFWVSPIVYKLEDYRKSLPGLDYINPMAGIIINARRVILNGQPPEWGLFYWGFAYAIFFLLIGVYILNKLGSKAAEKL